MKIVVGAMSAYQAGGDVRSPIAIRANRLQLLDWLEEFDPRGQKVILDDESVERAICGHRP